MNFDFDRKSVAVCSLNNKEELKMYNNIAEIIRLFQEQLSATRALLEKQVMIEGARVAAELSIHKRDQHLGYWDSTYYLEFGKEQRKEISELDKKIQESNKKITELIKANETPVETKKDPVLPFFDFGEYP